MIKKNLKILIITSLVILLPIAAGLILWNQLPENIPTHWNTKGEIDGYSSKAFAVLGLPSLMLLVQWLCVLATSADPKKEKHPQKVLHLVFWMIPVITVVLCTATYLAALGIEVRMEIIMPVIMGLVFIIVGNYLPKCKQNYTIGIKIPWTLESEENWNKTHRFAGVLWVVCGMLIMFTGIFGSFFLFIGITALMVLAPLIYSYILYKKGV
ncbi:MAG: DUF1648 domain-containing protein [Ruminococcaceae bacterium]|nr:DUF1648 domain-containing protein [Oscillospiraceae bacterium]